MHGTLRKLRDRRVDGDRGFTLIELLVVVVIIGVLVAIAIPVYLNYTKGAADKAAQADVRNAIIVVEQCYSDNANKYPSTQSTATPTAGLALAFAATPLPTCSGTSNVSDGVTLTYAYTAGTPGSYVLTGKNANGTKTYTYTSTTGKTVVSP